MVSAFALLGFIALFAASAHASFDDIRPCRETVESATQCLRDEVEVHIMGTGFPGVREHVLDRGSSRKVEYLSPFAPSLTHSPYGIGGASRPAAYRLKSGASGVTAYEEVWTPVSPLDTPLTQLHWVRGALDYNQLHFNLERMVSPRTYASFDIFANSASSIEYDYAEQIHQPYLSGWGLSGLFPALDRDSASLVLEGVSPSISSWNMRPRLGYWIDSNQVVEVFFDRFRNSTDLTLPAGTVGNDSLQALVPGEFGSSTGGVFLSGKWQSHEYAAGFTHGSFTRKEPLPEASGDALSVPSQTLSGLVDEVHGSLKLPILVGSPEIAFRARNELLEGRLYPRLPTQSGPVSEGWVDGQNLLLAWHPRLGPVSFDLGAEGKRQSLLNNTVHYLWGQNAGAFAQLPFGFTVGVGQQTSADLPDLSSMFRFNPLLFHYPSPDLQPRKWRSLRGDLEWEAGRFSLGSGISLHRIRDSWLPRLLPDSNPCGFVRAGVYSGLDTQTCADFDDNVADSLALGLRNYAQEDRDSWYWKAGIQLGNWNAALHHTLLFHSAIGDDNLSRNLENRTLPRHVYQGRLGWNRSLVENRLHVAVRWDWEWRSARYGWAPLGDGNSRNVMLDEFLALDFQAQMRIKSFTLFYKIINFNHDRFATEPGVHPPGVNFRFGVDWTIAN